MSGIVDWSRWLGASVLLGGGVGYFSVYPENLPSVGALGLMPGCNIKGNVSINTGERIYHVPGQEFYTATNIRTDYGERWFCTEEEALAAGWRRARN